MAFKRLRTEMRLAMLIVVRFVRVVIGRPQLSGVALAEIGEPQAMILNDMRIFMGEKLDAKFAFRPFRMIEVFQARFGIDRIANRDCRVSIQKGARCDQR